MANSALFDRWSAATKLTRPFLMFREHHTELNNLYWSFVPAASYASYLARHSPSGATPHTLLHIAGPDAIRVSHDIFEWQKSFKDFQNWVRLSIVMSAASYFELYMRSVVALAVLSDPYASKGAPRLIDGAKLIKHGLKSRIDNEVEGCVKGEWAKRARSFRLLFGEVPPILRSRMAELEAIRRVRNKVGHSFGRDIPSAWGLITAPIGSTERVSEKRAKLWLSVLHEVAIDVDGFLLKNSIGSFELLLEYHLWRSRPKTRHENRITEVAGFSKHIAQRYPPIKERRQYLRLLMDCYNAY